MKPLKQIKILPLKNLDDLQLKINKSTGWKVPTTTPENVQELIKLATAEARKIPGAIIASSLGEESFVNSSIRGSKDKKTFYTFPEPNPVCIYYKSANQHLETSRSIRLKLPKEGTNFNADDFLVFAEYFQETSEGIILLSSTIEGFINQLIPENITLTIGGVAKDKNGIEWLDPNTKIREVVPALTGIDFFSTNSAEYSKICTLIDIRNDLIHLKKSGHENHTEYQSLYKRLVDFDHLGQSDSVYTFVEKVTPGYFVLDEPKEESHEIAV
nr:hypothetical protein [uncultured Dyadobacter sp.]